MSVWIHRVNFMWNTHRKIERCHWTLVDRKRIQHGGRQKDLVTERWGDSEPVLDLVVWAWSAWLYRQFVLFSPSNQTCCKVFIMLFPWLEREKKREATSVSSLVSFSRVTVVTFSAHTRDASSMGANATRVEKEKQQCGQPEKDDVWWKCGIDEKKLCWCPCWERSPLLSLRLRVTRPRT